MIRVIREHFTPDFRRLLIDDTDAYEQVCTYLRATAPDLVSKVSRYDEEMPLFERYHVEDQLRKALDRRVFLPSGGHLVIDRTEALTVIDVNTGRFVGSSSLEETVLQNNLEAAEEIGRQLRLADIGGIIVIDFIDMESEGNQNKVLRKLRETLAKDKTRTQVFDVSHLGLVEMTRKNVSAGTVGELLRAVHGLRRAGRHPPRGGGDPGHPDWRDSGGGRGGLAGLQACRLRTSALVTTSTSGKALPGTGYNSPSPLFQRFDHVRHHSRRR